MDSYAKTEKSFQGRNFCNIQPLLVKLEAISFCPVSFSLGEEPDTHLGQVISSTPRLCNSNFSTKTHSVKTCPALYPEKGPGRTLREIQDCIKVEQTRHSFGFFGQRWHQMDTKD